MTDHSGYYQFANFNTAKHCLNLTQIIVSRSIMNYRCVSVFSNLLRQVFKHLCN